MALDEYSDFEPCLLVVFRNPSVVGRQSLEYGIHRANRVECSVDDHYIVDVYDIPIPLGTIKLLEDVDNDYYKPDIPMFCPDCFGELENEANIPRKAMR